MEYPIISRYFIAVIPPVAYSNKIEAFQKMHPENWFAGEVKPHITVKAPNGLIGGLGWLKSVRKVCKLIYPFNVTVNGPDSFGISVLFLKISSPGVFDLRRKLAGFF